MTPTPDLSPTEAAIVARFDAAEPAPESYVRQHTSEPPAKHISYGRSPTDHFDQPEPVVAGPAPCDRSPAEPQCPCGAGPLFHPVEPPAEAQQDDELSVDAVRFSPDGMARSVGTYTVELGGEQFTQEQWEAVQVYVARPSADTETLRRVRELADTWEHRAAAYGAHDDRDKAVELRQRATALRAALDAR